MSRKTFKMPGKMASPWSVAKIEAEKRRLRWRAASWINRHPSSSLVIALCIGGLAFTSFAYLCTPPMGNDPVMGSIGLGLFLLGIVIPVKCMLLVSRPREIALSLDPLDQDSCPEMLKLLDDVRNGESFRQAVLAQGRMFIQKELIDARQACNELVAHRKSVEERDLNRQITVQDTTEHQRSVQESCRKLYGISTEVA